MGSDAAGVQKDSSHVHIFSFKNNFKMYFERSNAYSLLHELKIQTSQRKKVKDSYSSHPEASAVTTSFPGHISCDLFVYDIMECMIITIKSIKM